jgi:hypothetical protein
MHMAGVKIKISIILFEKSHFLNVIVLKLFKCVARLEKREVS